MSLAAFTFPPHVPSYAAQDKATQDVLRSVRRFLQQELHISLEKTHCLLAVSGGADSLALLCLWQWLRPVYDLSFSVLHINHHLRPESTAEAHCVQALCAAWKIPCFVEDIYFEQKSGLEEAARHKRYALYEHYRQHCKASWVCLGHHLGDVQEDVLMRLIRGAAWPALGGMVALDTTRHILRPLLLQEPQSLRRILQKAGLSWAEDATNTDRHYLRNRVRHDILPYFHAENPAFAQKITEVWQCAQYDKEHWQEVIQNLCQEYHISVQENRLILPAKLLQKSNKATRLRLYTHALKALQNTDPNVHGQGRAQTLFKLDEALQAGRGNTLFQFSGSLTAKIHKNAITFELMIK